ncbi:Sulfite reductase, assimilatory-type [Desulfamplus magnetovallimortis]|uniref:Sulfite reductase, assimilatory-type n=1 Tax=Desulfamplus magnetovallimortis TaxID=1246637 RepID=A0A1W1H678_9BACT|nr:NAD(P)/FAD-dependent oxidoreductase [Desulfamplus magnetovallimortis]SLM27979.1 Sulfite reductase, assimilatory-type [Desulfamplus magnetovallimortis]
MLKLGEKGAVPQKDKETYAIAPHIPCGVITPDQLRTIADVADKYKAAAVKITSASRIAIVGLKEEDIDNVWKDLELNLGHAVGLCVRSIKACPGTAFCKLAQQDSLGMGMKLDEIYHGMILPSKTKMGVSGCTNQCAENCIKDVSLMGKKSGWTLMVGGNGASKPRLADTLAEELDDETALEMIGKIIAYYQENGKKGERIGKMIDRIGLDNMKAAIL